MLHGKKGFERIVWAFKNVLDSSVTWLFYDFQDNAEGTITRKEPASPCDACIGTMPADQKRIAETEQKLPETRSQHTIPSSRHVLQKLYGLKK